jgi:Bacterial aa3 type cytochrome c oxidase subunit IV
MKRDFQLDARKSLNSRSDEDMPMAADHHDTKTTAMDYAEHEKTFGLFAGLIKWGTVASLGITLLAGAATHTIPWLFALVVAVAITAIVAKFF